MVTWLKFFNNLTDIDSAGCKANAMHRHNAWASTWELILDHGPPEEHGWVGVQPHTLIHTSHDILQLCVVLHIGLLPVTQNFINLLLSLHGKQTCAFKPGCLMSHSWLHTPDCKVSNGTVKAGVLQQ